MVVTLIGYRATGKTTVGPELAKRLGWTCVDSDVEIEKQTGRSIAQIFADDGEPEFRRIERTVIAELLNRDKLVLSAGGGAILSEATRTQAKKSGPVIWLQASVDTIVQRLTADQTSKDNRPALTDHDDQRAEVTEVLKLRTKLYADVATIVIDTDKLDSHAVIEAAYEKVKASLSHGETP